MIILNVTTFLFKGFILHEKYDLNTFTPFISFSKRIVVIFFQEAHFQNFIQDFLYAWTKCSWREFCNKFRCRNVVDVQTTLHHRQNDAVCSLGIRHAETFEKGRYFSSISKKKSTSNEFPTFFVGANQPPW